MLKITDLLQLSTFYKRKSQPCEFVKFTIFRDFVSKLVGRRIYKCVCLLIDTYYVCRYTCLDVGDENDLQLCHCMTCIGHDEEISNRTPDSPFILAFFKWNIRGTMDRSLGRYKRFDLRRRDDNKKERNRRDFLWLINIIVYCYREISLSRLY